MASKGQPEDHFQGRNSTGQSILRGASDIPREFTKAASKNRQIRRFVLTDKKVRIELRIRADSALRIVWPQPRRTIYGAISPENCAGQANSSQRSVTPLPANERLASKATKSTSSIESSLADGARDCWVP